jgi:hypothetical protein
MDDTGTARRKLLDEGFSMARIGKHADHRTIVAELQRSAGFPLVRLYLESPGVLKQFDMICAEARKRATYEANRN